MAARRRGAARTEPVTPSEGGSSRPSRWHAAAAPAQPGTAPPRGRFGRQERGLPAPHRPAPRPELRPAAPRAAPGTAGGRCVERRGPKAAVINPPPHRPQKHSAPVGFNGAVSAAPREKSLS